MSSSSSPGRSDHPLGGSADPASPIEWEARGDFVDWLAATGGSLAVTTYNSGKLALLSAPRGELRIAAWKFARPMGLAFRGGKLALAVREQILEFELLRDADRGEGRFRASAIHRTGKLDVHEMAFDSRGLLFVATRFNCLARPSERVNFRRVWQPPFLREIIPRDCCHLNGVGLRDGRAQLVTAFCEGATPGAWRAEDRFASGVAIDVRSGATVVRGLDMPHSPRWHAGAWWLCTSGEGTLSLLDVTRGTCDEIVAVPGFTRGLTILGNRAVVGRSQIRKRHILDAPPVRRRFGKLRAGLSLVDLTRGRETGAIDFLKGGRETFDVAFLSEAPQLSF